MKQKLYLLILTVVVIITITGGLILYRQYSVKETGHATLLMKGVICIVSLNLVVMMGGLFLEDCLTKED